MLDIVEKEYTTQNFKRNTIKWYTDGSTTTTGAGAGIYGSSTKCTIALGSHSSAFQAEIITIEKCVDINLERNYQGCDIVIHSDSQAAIEALNSYVTDSKLIWECRSKLNEVGKKNKVSLVWVPGHSGIKGNEEADTLARKGAQTPLTGPEPFCGVCKNIYKKEFLEKEENKRELL
ncbi:ribonuclease H1-like [Coccinella septempunctata]|uniref:ribonuclease H1-like n=1 Tax=Coccinella septempunctata TaxID=41139 RepID=UPI001D09814A|nr:ribonuclease H1-like [Coccinella septempunctata]